MKRFGLVLVLLAAVFSQRWAAAEDIPVPRQKPAHAAGPQQPIVPVPRPKPGSQEPRVARTSAAWPGTSGEWPAAAVQEARADCDDLLRGLNVIYKPLPPIGREGGCGAPAPVEVSFLAGADVVPPATMNCVMAKQLHEWMVRAVQPAAKAKLKTSVTVIRNASSYVCRSRNGLAGGKLSEHGRANAFDMSGFAFAKSGGVEIGEGWGGILQSIGLSRSGSFLEQIRAEACRYFTTVLGPGSDAYHGDHFHVDAIQRKHGGRICK